MIDVPSWMKEAVSALQAQFGSRLLFVGLQGSHRRGEAREDSDIDILTILDSMDISDFAAYRTVLRRLPEGEKACGFTCGRKELLAWPAFELFQFSQDIDAYYGDLHALLPPFTRRDTETGARASVSSLYHATVHLYISGDEATRTDDLRSLYKGFFFAMQVVHYLRHGIYVHSKKALLPLLSNDEAELLRLNMDAAHYENRRRSDPDALFQLLLSWSGKVMRELAQESVGKDV